MHLWEGFDEIFPKLLFCLCVSTPSALVGHVLGNSSRGVCYPLRAVNRYLPRPRSKAGKGVGGVLACILMEQAGSRQLGRARSCERADGSVHA